MQRGQVIRVPLNRFPCQTFLLRRVVRHTTALKTRPVNGQMNILVVATALEHNEVDWALELRMQPVR